MNPCSRKNLLSFFSGFLFSRIAFGILAAEALHAASGVHKLLLAGKEGMAGSADFNADVSFMGRAGNKCVSASAMHADFTVVWMNSCFHVGSETSIQKLDFTGVRKDSARAVSAPSKAIYLWGKGLRTQAGRLCSGLKAEDSKNKTAGPTACRLA